MKNTDAEKSAMKLSFVKGFRNLLLMFMMLTFAGFTHAQLIQKGVVTDKKSGEPIIGANIIVKGSTTGTITDIDGKFTLQLPNNNAVLVVKYVGYTDLEIQASPATELIISMSENVQQIEELVVVGYGVQKKMDVSASISTISTKDLKGVPVTSSESLLQGRAAGVQVANNSGAPGSTVSVKIRGVVTTGDSEPLYVVDGMPMAAGGGDNKFGINSLNPNDIESIQILKDASSAAIYGSRGSNGVVLITTKRGKAGKPTITLESFLGTQSFNNRISVLNKEQYRQYYQMLGAYQPANNANTYDNIKPLDALIDDAQFASLPDVNWQDIIFTSAPTSNLQLSVSGGNDNSKFMISFGSSNTKGIVKGSDYTRSNFRINSDHTISKWFKIGESLNVSMSDRKRVYESGAGYDYISANPITTALLSDPTTTPLNDSGEYNYMKRTDTFNAVAMLDRANYKYNNKKINGNFYFQIEPIKGLVIKSSVGIDFTLGETKEFLPAFNVAGSRKNEGQVNSSLKHINDQMMYQIIENTISYNNSYEKHSYGLMIGQTAESNQFSNLWGKNTTISGTEDYLQYLDAGNPSDPSRELGGEAWEWRMYSYLGRLNYNYDNKYLLTASIRRDASSRFGTLNRAGVFPAFSFAWRMKNESFMESIDWLHDAKLRIGWGQVGNQNNIGNYPYNSVLYANSNYAFGNPASSTQGVTAGVTRDGYQGYSGGKPGNTEIKWETTQTRNAGVDLAFLNNAISLTADYFLKDNIDMLMPSTVPSYLGIIGPDVNAGKIANEGFELEVAYRKNKGDFNYDISGNFTYIKTKVVDFPTSVESNGGLSRTVQGGGLSDFYGLKTDGVFKSVEEVQQGPFIANGTKPGDVRFVDINKDGIINESDYTVIGNPMPDFTYGLTTNFYYKNFDLNLFIQGVGGNEIYNNLYRIMMGKWGVNHHTDILNAWTPENPTSNIPRLEDTSLSNNIRVMSDRWIEDGSYLRLKTVSLGYTLPKAIISKLKISNLRIYSTVQNLLTFTNYKGFDPEVSQDNGWKTSGLDIGVDNGKYPQPTTILFGINVSL
jgi:TonB-linked SusC/RagA family outer membrane protein